MYIKDKFLNWFFSNSQRPKPKGQFGGTFRRKDRLKRRKKINSILNRYVKGDADLDSIREISQDSNGKYIKGL